MVEFQSSCWKPGCFLRKEVCIKPQNIINSDLLYNEQEQVSKSVLDDCRLESLLDKRNPWWKKANGKEILGKTVHRNMNMEHGNGKILAGLTGHKEKRKGNARAGSATCSISFEKRLPMAGSRESGFFSTGQRQQRHRTTIFVFSWDHLLVNLQR